MSMTLDDTIDQLLRGGKVSIGRVYKCSGGHVVNLEGDGERSVGRDGVKVPGGVEFEGWLPETW